MEGSKTAPSLLEQRLEDVGPEHLGNHPYGKRHSGSPLEHTSQFCGARVEVLDGLIDHVFHPRLNAMQVVRVESTTRYQEASWLEQQRTDGGGGF